MTRHEHLVGAMLAAEADLGIELYWLDAEQVLHTDLPVLGAIQDLTTSEALYAVCAACLRGED